MLKSLIVLICLSFSLITFSQNNPPVADPGYEYYGTRNGDSPVPVTLHAYDSYDPDIPDDEIVKYKWDTDNDGLFGADDNDGSMMYGGDSDAEGVEVEVVYDWLPGNSYQIYLIVEDSHGATSTAASTTIHILPYSTAIPINIINLTYDGYVSGDGLFKLKIIHPYADAQTFDASFIMYPDDMTLDCFDGEDNPVTQLNYPGGNVKTEYNIYYNSTEFEDAINHYSLKSILTKTGEVYEVVKITRPFTIDNTPPDITCPANQVRPAGESDIYTAMGTEFDPVSATDNLCDPEVFNDINLLETLDGYLFNVGTTTVTWTAEDLAGNIDQCSFDVEISPYTDILDEKSNTLCIYPNPAGNYLVVDPGSNNVGSIILIDPAGRIVKRIKAEENGIKMLDVGKLKPGLYTISVKFGDQRTTVQKVVISK